MISACPVASWILFVAASITVAATSACEREPEARSRTRPCTDITTSDRYFPPDAFVPQQIDVDDELRETLGHYLEAANETSWICGDVTLEGYRLFIGGGYGLRSIVVSIVRSSSRWRIAVSEFDPLKPGAAYVVHKRSHNEVDRMPSEKIRQALQTAAFWSGPTWQQIEAEADIVLIEVLDGNDHRAVIQAVPTAEFRAVATLILRVATGSGDFLGRLEQSP